MPKKNFSPAPATNKLSRQFFTQRAEMLRVRQTDEVAVPSFGEGMTVNVKGLTVADKNLMAQLERQGRDAMSIVAALCAVDDDGQLVFGQTKGEAVDTVESLPEYMRYDVAMIATAAMKLSGRPVGPEASEETAVAEAEKN